ncbi:MAG: NTP transferase domain-containing protein [Chloroflexi bacterium]|nr:NTP transferase domain-containing protein [Chloroflexota bacterium]
MSAVGDVRTAVIPAGGLGTRFLPFTRTLPKELLPLVDTPVIDLVVSECAAAGIERVIIVGAPGKEALLSYFRPSERVRARLDLEGRTAELAAALRPEGLAEVLWVVQEEARGNGHAVLVAKEAVENVPFAMIWGDDVLVGPEPGASQLARVRAERGGSVAGAMLVEPGEVGRYGILGGTAVDARTIKVERIVEKPDPATAPGRLASIHGYVLDPAIFPALEECPPGRGGELWLTDAVSLLARSAPVWGLQLEGTRYDAGAREGYVAAFVDSALERPDTGPALRAHLRALGWREPGGR